MSEKLEQWEVSNQQKILQLQEKIRKVDTIYPRASSNLLGPSSFPSADPASKPSLKNVKNHDHFHQLEQHYRQLESSLNQKVDQHYRMLQGVEIEVRSLQEEVRLAKKEAERSRESMQQRASHIEKEASQEAHQQAQETKGLRKELAEAIDKKYRTIKLETMAALGTHFDSGWEQARQELSTQVEELRTSIQQEQVARDQALNYMVNSFGEEILKLEQQVQRQREQREESHRRVTEGLQRMEEQVAMLILQEKKEASVSIGQLQDFLEELCLKIESRLLS